MEGERKRKRKKVKQREVEKLNKDNLTHRFNNDLTYHTADLQMNNIIHR